MKLSTFLCALMYLSLLTQSARAQIYIPVPVLRDHYGALAYSPSKREYGWGNNHYSSVDAKAAAIETCEAYAKSGDCIVVHSFWNGCGTLVEAPKGGVTTGLHTYRPNAEYEALKECYDLVGSGCKVLETVCTAR